MSNNVDQYSLEQVITAMADLYLIPPDFLKDPDEVFIGFMDEEEEKAAASLVSSYFSFMEEFLKRRGLMK